MTYKYDKDFFFHRIDIIVKNLCLKCNIYVDYHGI